MIKRITVFMLTMSLLLSVYVPAVSAESLWSNQSSSLFSDNRARNVGDIITIIISESSSATRTGSASNSKDSSVNVGAGTGSMLGWITNHSLTGKDGFSAKGALTNSNNVRAAMTAQVVAVQPNGNLLIEGVQEIKQNKETQNIRVTGEIRPLDIKSDNTIQSTYIANAKIFVDGKGFISDKQKDGILTQIWNFIF